MVESCKPDLKDWKGAPITRTASIFSLVQISSSATAIAAAAALFERINPQDFVRGARSAQVRQRDGLMRSAFKSPLSYCDEKGVVVRMLSQNHSFHHSLEESLLIIMTVLNLWELLDLLRQTPENQSSSYFSYTSQSSSSSSNPQLSRKEVAHPASSS